MPEQDPGPLEGGQEQGDDARRGLTRRETIRAGALAAGAVAVAATAVGTARAPGPTGDPVGEGTRRSLPVLVNTPRMRGEDVLIRMQRELVTAMAKKVEDRSWIMVIDTRKCVGCDACTIACVAENNLPPGVVYRPVVQQEFGTYPNVQLRFTPRPCMQCDEPPCVSVCPQGRCARERRDVDRPDGQEHLPVRPDRRQRELLRHVGAPGAGLTRRLRRRAPGA